MRFDANPPFVSYVTQVYKKLQVKRKERKKLQDFRFNVFTANIWHTHSKVVNGLMTHNSPPQYQLGQQDTGCIASTPAGPSWS